MTILDELDNSEVQSSLPKSNNGSVQSFIKVKLSDGSFQTIIPISNTNSILDASGRTLDLELLDINGDIESNRSSIEDLCEKTNLISTNMTELVDYVDPLMDELRSHIEVVDFGNEVESTIFDHVYTELDTITEKMQTIENSLGDIMSKLNKVIADNNNLSKTVENLSAKLASHEDTIV